MITSTTLISTRIVSNLKKCWGILFVLSALFSTSCFSQDVDEEGSRTITISREGFKYSLKGPNGWVGDTVMALNYYANIVFYAKEEDPFNEDKTIIQIYFFKVKDRRVDEELKYDINSYREDNKALIEKEFTVGNMYHKCYSKLVYVKDNFYQYLVYVDPGKKYNCGFSISMKIPQAATENELNAYRKIIYSLKLEDTTNE